MKISNLAACVRAQSRLQEAGKLHRNAFAIRMRVLGGDHAATLTSESNLADVLFGEDHIREVERLQREALAAQVRVLGS